MALHFGNEDFSSEFETDSESERKRKKRLDLAVKQKKSGVIKASTSDLVEKASNEERIKQRHHILSLDAYARHKKLINDYFLTHKGAWAHVARDTSKDRNDADIIRENHKFLWDDEPGDSRELNWDQRLAKKYYDKLFKEYCIADLSRYKENKVALRWRIEKEVVVGKGQFICGNKHCDIREGLKSWELNFAYLEHGVKKNALVKLRLCPSCSKKLNYHHQRKEVNRKKRKHSSAGDDTDGGTSTDTVSKKMKSDESSSGEAKKEDSTEETKDTQSADASAIWSQPIQITEDKSREEEFEEYLADILL